MTKYLRGKLPVFNITSYFLHITIFLFLSFYSTFYCSSEHPGLLDWRRSFFGIFSVCYTHYLQDLQNWYRALVSELLPSFPGWKRYVYVVVRCTLSVLCVVTSRLSPSSLAKRWVNLIGAWLILLGIFENRTHFYDV